MFFFSKLSDREGDDQQQQQQRQRTTEISLHSLAQRIPILERNGKHGIQTLASDMRGRYCCCYRSNCADTMIKCTQMSVSLLLYQSIVERTTGGIERASHCHGRAFVFVLSKFSIRQPLRSTTTYYQYSLVQTVSTTSKYYEYF